MFDNTCVLVGWWSMCLGVLVEHVSVLAGGAWCLGVLTMHVSVCAGGACD